MNHDGDQHPVPEGSRPGFNWEDPYDSRDYRLPWFYAWLYGHPGFDRPPFVSPKTGPMANTVNMASTDARIFMVLAGLVDFVLVQILAVFLPLWILFPANFIARAWLSDIWGHVTDPRTTWEDACLAVMEVCPSPYFQAAWTAIPRLGMPMSSNLLASSAAYFVFDRRIVRNATPAEGYGNMTWSGFIWHATKATVMELVAPFAPLVLVVPVLLAIIGATCGFLLLKAVLLHPLLQNIIDDVFDFLTLVVCRAVTAVQKAISLLLPVAQRAWKPTIVKISNLVVQFMQFQTHVLRSSASHGGVAGLLGKTDDEKFEYLSAVFRKSRLVRLPFSDPPRQITWWTPSKALALENIKNLGCHLQDSARYLLERLSRDHPATTASPYLPLKEGQIRLLRILPAPVPSQVLKCEVVMTTPAGASRYIALSYRWSSQWSNPAFSTEPVVIVNGCRLEVGIGTFEALRALRSRWRTITVWVDAICINQADMDEVPKQVRIMASIYASAQKVVIWLGDPTDSRLAARMLWFAWTRCRLLHPELAGQVFGGRIMSPSFQAFRDLFRREWFERCWIVQEIAVSKSVEIRYGKFTIPWDIVVSFAAMMSKGHPLMRYISSDAGATHWLIGPEFHAAGYSVPWLSLGTLGLLITPRFVKPVLTFDGSRTLHLSREPITAKGAVGLRHTRRLQFLRTSWTRGKRFPLSYHLRSLYCNTSKFYCFDPHDRIYSVLSFSADQNAVEFMPDYTKPISLLYRAVAKYYYTLGESMLSECGRGYEYPARHQDRCQHPPPYTAATCHTCELSCPSWVPDWAQNRVHYLLERERDDVGLSGSLDAGQTQLLFNASKGRRFRCTFADDPRFMIIHGTQHIDKVSYLGAVHALRYLKRVAGLLTEADTDTAKVCFTHYSYEENIPLWGPGCWLSLALQHGRNPYPDATAGRISVTEALFRTITLDGSSSKSDRGLHFDSGGKPISESAIRFAEYATCLKRFREGETPGSVFGIEGGLTDKLERYLGFRFSLRTCQGRRLGVTASGLLGLFPLGTSEGDDVCLIEGMTTPFVFRSCGIEGGRQQFENIGECYIQGAMQGEMWASQAGQDIMVQ